MTTGSGGELCAVQRSASARASGVRMSTLVMNCALLWHALLALACGLGGQLTEVPLGAGGHALPSSVQHLGPPPALRSSETSTPTVWYPAARSSAVRWVAWAGSTTVRPSLTALRPNTAASSAFATIACGKSCRRTACEPGEKAGGKYATLVSSSTHSAVSRW